MMDKSEGIIVDLFSRMPWLREPAKSIIDRFQESDIGEVRTLFCYMDNVLEDAFNNFEKNKSKEELFEVYREKFAPLWHAVLLEIKASSQFIEDEAVHQDARSISLMKLVMEAHKSVPFSPLDAFQSFYKDIYFYLLGPCQPLSEIRDAQNQKGEKRSRAIKQAISDTVEFLYKPYIHILWKLQRYIEKRNPGRIPALGAAVNQLSRKFEKEYPGLVDVRVVKLRNASAHYCWEYLPDQDAISIWDQNKKEEIYASEELMKIIDDIWLISGPTIRNITNLFVYNELFMKNGLLESALKYMEAFINKEEESKLSILKLEMEISIENLVSPLKEFWSKTAIYND